MLITARAVAQDTRKGRTTPAVRPLSKMLISSANDNNTEALRIQRLRLLGIIGHRASLVANLAWGDLHHG